MIGEQVVKKANFGRTDDFVLVPSKADFVELENEIRALNQEIANSSSSLEAVNRKIASSGKVLEGLKEELLNSSDNVESIKANILAELTDGDWQKILHDIIRGAAENLENKIKEANQISANQISQLVKHEATIRILTDSFWETIKTESQTIRWE